MHSLRVHIALVILTLLYCCTDQTPIEIIEMLAEPTDTILVGQRMIIQSKYTVDNNCWASVKMQKEIDQNLYLYEDCDSLICGWKWDWSATGATEVSGFPNINFGKDPWLTGEEITPELPCRLDLLKDASVSFAIIDSTKGANCTSISSWLVEKDGDNLVIRDEILIRLNGDSLACVGELISENIVIDGLAATIYKRACPLNDTAYYSYTVALKEEYLTGVLDIKKWIDSLITTGIVSNKDEHKYLSQIQLGSEIQGGTGTVFIKQFDVQCDVIYEPVEILLDSTLQYKDTYIFHNNCWGSADLENSIDQKFYHYPESDTLCSWHWDWKSQGDGTIYSYPNVHLGKDIWLNHDYELAPFPGLLHTLTDFTVDFQISGTATGASSTSIAYWLSNGGAPSDLIVFRLNNDNLPAIGSHVDSNLTIDNHTVSVYTGFVDEGAIAYNTIYVEFPQHVLNGTFDLKKWNDHFMSAGYITDTNNTKNLDQILIGTETAGGTGDLYVKKFDVQCSLTTVKQNYISYTDGPDIHEAFLNHFDTLGIDVILAVETGHAETDTIMDIVMKRYKHHPSVIGYGVDVEWRTKDADLPNYGRKVSDDEAESLDKKLKESYGNPNYRLVLKHWDTRWMPPTYRGTNNDIIFINDGQSFADQASQLSFFEDWCDTYENNDVMFQIGYESDHPWWKDMKNPVKTIGDAIAAKKSPTQNAGMLWVDFSANYPEVELLKYSDSTDSKGSPLTNQDFIFEGESDVTMAGLRITSYGPVYNGNPYTFPTVESNQWGYAIRNIQKEFPGSRPVILWAVGHLAGTNCMLEFPQE